MVMWANVWQKKYSWSQIFIYIFTWKILCKKVGFLNTSDEDVFEQNANRYVMFAGFCWVVIFDEVYFTFFFDLLWRWFCFSFSEGLNRSCYIAQSQQFITGRTKEFFIILYIFLSGTVCAQRNGNENGNGNVTLFPHPEQRRKEHLEVLWFGIRFEVCEEVLASSTLSLFF